MFKQSFSDIYSFRDPVIYPHPPSTKFREIFMIHSVCLSVCVYVCRCLSVRLSVQIRVWSITNFLSLNLANYVWHMGESPLGNVSRTFLILIRRWPLTSGQVYRNFDKFLCPAYNVLAYLTWELKCAFLIACCPSSVRLSVLL